MFRFQILMNNWFRLSMQVFYHITYLQCHMLAEHRKLKAYRAVKCVSKSAHPMQPQLLLEADILKNLKHPGIPTIYDVEEDGKHLLQLLYHSLPEFGKHFFQYL